MALHGFDRTPPLVRVTSGFALALCLVLAPIQSAIWNGAKTPGWIDALPVQSLINSVGGALPTLTSYDLFGRMFVLVYLAAIAALTWINFGKGAARTRSSMLLTTQAALVVAAVAGFVAYWIAGWADPTLRDLAFWRIEVPALAVTCLSLSIFGISAIRSGLLPRREAWVTALTPVSALAATAAVQYMPHGPMIGICLTLWFLCRVKPAS